ncbi:wax ester/triacylglycerol synthase family O-acyltransferase [Haloechinothrix sp. LS1_15]|uniref:wax ester/triacylglycerol synthase family O-acyltransferase n=1 Tax=Haloechinothrix sp. LS1_15 TaxID=2652248 RepID=UPI00294AC731|nr:wax ester/triacylglycerol synthase family O-acyltransferase [Haloechinothrix sp. LS1_15]
MVARSVGGPVDRAATRLSGLDVSFLCLEGSHRPMHLGAALVFEPDCPVHPARIGRLLAERAAAVPELARTATDTWWPPAGKAWRRCPTFDPADHIHTHMLARPGQPEQLEAAAATVMAQPLLEGRPPWEAHVFGGVAHGRFAVVFKMHHALADAAGSFSVAAPLLDGVPPGRGRQARPADSDPSTPPTLPGPAALAGWAARTLRDLPGTAADAVAAASGVRRRVERLAGVALSTLAAVRPLAASSPVTSMLAGSSRREAAFVRLDTDEMHRVRKWTGGTLNDVVLSVIAGGLGDWIRNRDGAAAGSEWNLRAFVPVSVRSRRDAAGEGGNHLSGYLCDLPAGTTDPIERVRMVTGAMQRNKRRGPERGAGAFPLLAEAVPAGMHRVTTPLAAQVSPLLFDTMVSTVPLPDVPLALDGARLRQIWPLAPLALGQALSVAVTVYRGSVRIGVLADPQVLGEVGGLGDAIAKAFTNLRNACEGDS